jgi:hypothetical protein
MSLLLGPLTFPRGLFLLASPGILCASVHLLVELVRANVTFFPRTISHPLTLDCPKDERRQIERRSNIHTRLYTSENNNAIS